MRSQTKSPVRGLQRGGFWGSVLWPGLSSSQTKSPVRGLQPSLGWADQVVQFDVANKKPRKGIATGEVVKPGEGLSSLVANKKPRKGIATMPLCRRYGLRYPGLAQTNSPLTAVILSLGCLLSSMLDSAQIKLQNHPLQASTSYHPSHAGLAVC